MSRDYRFAARETGSNISSVSAAKRIGGNVINTEAQDEISTRRWIRHALSERYGSDLERLILAGSRARGTSRPDSDWDIIAVIRGKKTIWPECGPLRLHDKLSAPDGNEVEVFEVNPDDLCHPLARENHLIRDALEYDTDV